MAKKSRILNPKDTSHKALDNLIHTAAKNVDQVEKKHQQIVHGACKIFLEKGFHPTSVRDIAQACGMSMGQLYHYISSKDDVLYLVHKYMQNVWFKYLERSRYENVKDPAEKLLRALNQTLVFTSKNRKLIQFVYSESKYLGRKHLQAVLKMDKENVISFWRQLLEDLYKNKPIKTDLSFTASLIAFLTVFLTLRSWTLRNRPAKKNMDSLVDFIVRGLGISK